MSPDLSLRHRRSFAGLPLHGRDVCVYFHLVFIRRHVVHRSGGGHHELCFG